MRYWLDPQWQLVVLKSYQPIARRGENVKKCHPPQKYFLIGPAHRRSSVPVISIEVHN